MITFFPQLHLYVYLTVKVLPLDRLFWRTGVRGDFIPLLGGSLPILYGHIHFPLFPPPLYYSVWLSFTSWPEVYNFFRIVIRYKPTLHYFLSTAFQKYESSFLPAPVREVMSLETFFKAWPPEAVLVAWDMWPITDSHKCSFPTTGPRLTMLHNIHFVYISPLPHGRGLQLFLEEII